jgi:hypothetical protein
MKKLVYIGCLLIACTLQAQKANYVTGQEISDEYNVIVTGVQFLSITPDSRSGAMGDIGAATSGDVWSQSVNASKYAMMEKKYGVGLSYVPWLKNLGVKDEKLIFLSGYSKLGEHSAVGGSLRYFNMGDVPSYDDEGNDEGYDISPREFSFDASYSRKLLDCFAMGMTARFVYSNMIGEADDATHSGKAVSIDLSGMYEKPIRLRRAVGVFNARAARYIGVDYLRLGFCLSNLGSKISYTAGAKDFLPINLRLGAGYTKQIDNIKKVTFGFEINKLLVPTPPLYMYDDKGNVVDIQGKDNTVGVLKGVFQSLYDAPNGFSEEMKEFMFGVGMEYCYNDMLFARIGYFNEAKTKGNRKYFSAGLGFRYEMLNVDFSYMIPTNGKRSPLANTFRCSMSCEF